MTIRTANVLGISVVSGIIILLFLLPRWAMGQTSHDKGHPNYQSWYNLNSKSCCNNDDCQEVEERQNKGKTEVLVQGLWCPVESWMFLKQGNAPNWSSAHACVLKDNQTLHEAWYPTNSTCERLICYQPKAGF